MYLTGSFTLIAIEQGEPGESVVGFFSSAKDYDTSTCVDLCSRKEPIRWEDDTIREPKGELWTSGARIQLAIRCSNGDNYISYQRVEDHDTLFPLSYFIQHKGSKMRSSIWRPSQNFTSGEGGEAFYDVVIYDKKKYLCVKSHTSVEGVPPPLSISQHEGLWVLAQDWEFVATQLLLAEKITADQIDADGIEAKNVNLTGEINAQKGCFGGSLFVHGEAGKEGISTYKTALEAPVEEGITNFILCRNYLEFHTKINGWTNSIRIRPDYPYDQSIIPDEGILTISASSTKNKALCVQNGISVFKDRVELRKPNYVVLDCFGVAKFHDNILIDPGENGFVKICGIQKKVVDVYKDYVVKGNDNVLVVRNSTSIKITLPTGNIGQHLEIKHMTANMVSYIGGKVIRETGKDPINFSSDGYAIAFDLTCIEYNIWYLKRLW